MLNDLDKLALKYGADKWGKHHYTPVYYDLFKERRQTVKKVLEIGIAEGASLRMWRDFFSNATIYGADNDFKRVIDLVHETSIETYKCDQSIHQDLTDLMLEIGTIIDLVIDDGSHKPEDQISTCLTLMSILWTDAVYVIEDVADPSIIEKIGEKYNCELKRVGKRYDDQLVIVRHKNG